MILKVRFGDSRGGQKLAKRRAPVLALLSVFRKSSCVSNTDLLIQGTVVDSGIQGAIGVSGRPALLRQRDLKQALMAAKKAGAKELRVLLGGDISMVIPLVPDDTPVEPDGEISL